MYAYRLLIILAIILHVFSLSVARGFENAVCLSCHGDQGIEVMPGVDERTMETPVEPTEVPLEMQAYVQTGL